MLHGYLFMFSSSVDRCDHTTWEPAPFILVIILDFFKIAANGYVLLLGGFLCDYLWAWRRKIEKCKSSGECFSSFAEPEDRMNSLWHCFPWLWAFLIPGSLVLWKFDKANYEYFYGLSFTFYLGTTFFSICVYFFSTWNMKENVAPYKLPPKVEATLQLMVKVYL